MGRRPRPRSELRSERNMYPELGARHHIVDSDELGFLFSDIDTVLAQFIPMVPVVDGKGIVKLDKQGNQRKKKLYRVYDNPEKAGISILERRLPSEYARKHRLQWTRQDVGRIKGDIQNEIGRLELADRPLIANFTGVVRLGDADAESENARKIGLVVDQLSTEAEFFVREHALCINGIKTSMQRFRYPYSTFVPHFTVGRIYKEVPVETMNKAIAAIQGLLPIELELEPLRFTSEQEV